MSLESVPNCPVCEGTRFTPHIICTDHLVTNETFHVEQCGQCALLLTNPRPTEETAGKYYQSSAYLSHTAESSGIFARIYLYIRRLSIVWKYTLLPKPISEAFLLDIGCGTGDFIHHGRKIGYTVQGVEVSDAARQHCIERKLDVKPSIRALTNNKYHVITLWHVLEHLYHVDEVFQFLREHIEKNGTVLIAVPNHGSHDATCYGNQWAAYDTPRHLWHFRRHHIKQLAERFQFKVRTIHPMKLDAYYVALLSEQYKGYTGLHAMLRAITMGLRSNWKARQTGEYSSLIYELQPC